MILPGATLGVLGGGQLGRMFVTAARTMGYRVQVFDPDAESPAGRVADLHLRADFGDTSALAEFGRSCAAVTTEFENVPAAALRLLSGLCVVRPSADAVAIAQDRAAEKRFIQAAGIDVAPFVVIESRNAIAAVSDAVAFPAILKRSRFGYDGKGQIVVARAADLDDAFVQLGEVACVLEQRLALASEISVIVARDEAACVAFPPAENRHRNGILDISIVPARVSNRHIERATALAKQIAERLDYYGVLAVEFFITQDDRLYVNELAPRPHNSGHYTLDACVTDQFEQQVRTLCGLALGDTRLLSPAVMVNLLGDVWRGTDLTQAPAWDLVLKVPHVKLHLYGKAEARSGRKMGHYTCLAPTVDEALRCAEAVRADLLG